MRTGVPRVTRLVAVDLPRLPATNERATGTCTPQATVAFYFSLALARVPCTSAPWVVSSQSILLRGGLASGTQGDS